MNGHTISIDPSATRLRRVGRMARRRMRIDGATLRNGVHTDGTLTVRIHGLDPSVAGVPDAFAWEADRPIALVILRAGVDGEDVSFHVGPATSGIASATVGDGSGIRYVAFCYDAPVATADAAAPTSQLTIPIDLTPAPVPAPSATVRVRRYAPTLRERRSLLGQLLKRPSTRLIRGSIV